MSGLLQVALRQRRVDLSQMAVNGSFSPLPGSGQEVAHGHKGKGTLLHLLIDGLGNPLAITTTAANKAEREEVAKLIARVKQTRKLCERMTVLEPDKGYDADWLRQALGSVTLFL